MVISLSVSYSPCHVFYDCIHCTHLHNTTQSSSIDATSCLPIYLFCISVSVLQTHLHGCLLPHTWEINRKTSWIANFIHFFWGSCIFRISACGENTSFLEIRISWLLFPFHFLLKESVGQSLYTC